MIAKVLSSPALEPLRHEIRDRATDALNIARDKMMQPILHSRDAVMKRASQIERYANDQCERFSAQVRANPLTTVAIAFAAGWFAASIFGRAPRQRLIRPRRARLAALLPFHSKPYSHL